MTTFFNIVSRATLLVCGMGMLFVACSHHKSTNSPPAPTPQSTNTTSSANASPAATMGASYAGEYNLGPVAWQGSYTNSCGPYPQEIVTLEEDSLAGLGTNYNGTGQMCDACISIVTAGGRSILARVITNGETTASNNIDVSQSVYDVINQGEYPRQMTWQVAQCPDRGPMRYQFQTGANVYWTSLWVRNIRWPLKKVEVKSAQHSDWTVLRRGTDGTYTADDGFGNGAFSLRITFINDQAVTDSFDGFTPGGILTSLH